MCACVRPVCLCGPWLMHLCCYRRSKPDVTLDWSAGRGIQVGTKERVEQIERDRARGQRRSTRWSEALSHQLALWPLSQSLSFFFLPFTLSITLSFPLFYGLCLLIISLPVTIPTTFSGVTQQKKEGASLTVAGAVIWVSSHTYMFVLISLWGLIIVMIFLALYFNLNYPT